MPCNPRATTCCPFYSIVRECGSSDIVVVRARARSLASTFCACSPRARAACLSSTPRSYVLRRPRLQRPPAHRPAAAITPFGSFIKNSSLSLSLANRTKATVARRKDGRCTLFPVLPPACNDARRPRFGLSLPCTPPLPLSLSLSLISPFSSSKTSVRPTSNSGRTEYRMEDVVNPRIKGISPATKIADT